MIKIKFIFFVMLFFISSCGYTPLWEKNNSNNIFFKIELAEQTGNNQINRFLNSNLSEYKASNSDQKFLISIKSKYLKEALSKDKTGKVLENKLKIIIRFEIDFNENIEVFSLEEDINLKTSDDIIDEKNQERNLMRSLTSIIAEKLILKLASYNDN